MGNPKMRFSEILPNANAWFHKLNQIPKSTKTTTKNHPTPPLSAAAELHGELPLSLSPPRKSYHFTRSLINPKSPESKSSIRRIRRRPTATVALSSNSGNSGANSVISEDQSVFSGRRRTGESVSSVSSLELHPIKTEREKFSHPVKKISGPLESIDEKRRSSGKCRRRSANGSFSVNVVREESAMASSVSSFKEQGNRFVRRSPNGSPRVRIRVHSPRIARRAQVHSTRGSLSSSPSKKGVSSKSLAVVKSSSDPQRDFRESMVEMIVENNIRSSKDLEELLACYLSLNSDQYHDVIIEAFTQIWFDLNNIMKEIKR